MHCGGHVCLVLCRPVVEAEVSVSELLQQGALHHAVGGLVLEEVDQDVLQAGVLLG